MGRHAGELLMLNGREEPVCAAAPPGSPPAGRLLVRPPDKCAI
jgi:hypothetical protein